MVLAGRSFLLNAERRSTIPPCFVVQNLLYMTRLGLWGPSTAFPNRLDFVKLLNARGVGASRCLTCCGPALEHTVVLVPVPSTLSKSRAFC